MNSRLNDLKSEGGGNRNARRTVDSDSSDDAPPRRATTRAKRNDDSDDDKPTSRRGGSNARKSVEDDSDDAPPKRSTPSRATRKADSDSDEPRARKPSSSRQTRRVQDSSDEEDNPRNKRSTRARDSSEDEPPKRTPARNQRRVDDDSEDDQPKRNTARNARNSKPVDSDDEPPKRTQRGKPQDSSEDEPPKRTQRGKPQDSSEDEPPKRTPKAKPQNDSEDEEPKKATAKTPARKNDDKPRSDSVDSEEGQDIEMQATTPFMEAFFQEVNSIKSGLHQIKRNIKQIEEGSAQALVAVGVEASQKSSEELEKLIDNTNLTASEVRNKLKEMDVQIKKTPAKEQATAEFRITTNMHQTLTKKFLDLMKEYQEVQNTYKNKYKERVERQYRIVKPDATSEEIDAALESGNTQIFADQILDKKRHTAAKEALAYIENRHKDIIRLEQSIQELHQLFLDLAILVEAQGELIDQIEYNVSQAASYTKEAAKQLADANKYQKRSRKKMCCIIVILLIVFAVLAGLGGGLGGAFG